MNLLLKLWRKEDCYQSDDADMLRIGYHKWGRDESKEYQKFRVITFIVLFPNSGGFQIELLLYGWAGYRKYNMKVHPSDYQDWRATTYSFPMRWPKENK